MRLWITLTTLLLTATSFAASPATTQSKEPPGGRIIQPKKREVPGQRFAIGDGEMFVPDFFSPGEKTDVVLWFLGAPWVVEQEFYDAHKNAVLLVANDQLVKSNFPGPRHFSNLISNIQTALKKKSITDKPIGKVVICSFSGGYTVVRQLLTFEEIVPLISDVVLCDSLYANHTQGPESDIDDIHIGPFLAFARRAAAGEKTFLFSQLYPPEEKYRNNTTTLTAMYLIEHVGAKKVECKDKTSFGTPILYRADMNGFHVFGYAGMTNQDHFNHLYGMHDLFKLTSLKDAK
jgi:hypothetical protein